MDITTANIICVCVIIGSAGVLFTLMFFDIYKTKKEWNKNILNFIVYKKEFNRSLTKTEEKIYKKYLNNKNKGWDE
jgi:hypothetical protein